jgi:predicted phage-related endonuclease
MALGMSPYKTKLRLYREKRGEPIPVEEEDEEADLPLLVGQACEPVVLEKLCKRKNITVHSRQKQFISPVLPYVRATVDGIGSDGSNTQAKTAGYLGTSWGVDGSDEIPMHIIYQVQAEMHCANLPFSWVPAIIGNNKLRIYRVDRDPALWDLMVEPLSKFWWHVRNGVPPEAQNRADIKLLYPYDIGSQRTANEEIEIVVREYVGSKATEKDVKETIERLYVMITGFMGAANELLDRAGNVIMTYSTQNGPSRLDKEAIEAEHPGIIEEHTKPGEPVRVLRIKKPSVSKKKRK